MDRYSVGDEDVVAARGEGETLKSFGGWVCAGITAGLPGGVLAVLFGERSLTGDLLSPRWRLSEVSGSCCVKAEFTCTYRVAYYHEETFVKVHFARGSCKIRQW